MLIVDVNSFGISNMLTYYSRQRTFNCLTKSNSAVFKAPKLHFSPCVFV